MTVDLSTIQALTFDVGGTIFDWHSVVVVGGGYIPLMGSRKARHRAKGRSLEGLPCPSDRMVTRGNVPADVDQHTKK